MSDASPSRTLRLVPGSCARRPAEACDKLQALQQQLQATQQALDESQARERLALHLASHDALTGLPNRRAFGLHSDHTLGQHAASAQTFCLMYIDLDGFKSINDDLGHSTGDALLRIIGERLLHAVRSDDFVSRLGGDEFVCVLPQLGDEARALQLARKLIDAISAPAQVGRHTVQVRASVGLALFPRDGDTVATLVERADHAMRQAKALSGGGACGWGADAAR